MNPDHILHAHAGLGRLETIAETAIATLRAFCQALAVLHRAWASARARRELHALSDRTLNDIGLSRGQIDALFR